MLEQSGIDSKVFKGHSTKAASTSAAKQHAISLDTIMACAGWSNVQTFAKFYHKEIEAKPNYGQLLLTNVVN